MKTLWQVIDDAITSVPIGEEASSDDITPAALDWVEKMVKDEIPHRGCFCRDEILRRIKEEHNENAG